MIIFNPIEIEEMDRNSTESVEIYGESILNRYIVFKRRIYFITPHKRYSLMGEEMPISKLLRHKKTGVWAYSSKLEKWFHCPFSMWEYYQIREYEPMSVYYSASRNRKDLSKIPVFPNQIINQIVF